MKFRLESEGTKREMKDNEVQVGVIKKDERERGEVKEMRDNTIQRGDSEDGGEEGG